MSASAQLIFSAVAQTEIQTIFITNNDNAVRKFSFFHDDDGNEWTADTALFNTATLEPRQVIVLGATDYGTGITIAAGGALGFKSETTAAVTISVYGTTRIGR